MTSVCQATDIQLQHELEARGYFVMPFGDVDVDVVAEWLKPHGFEIISEFMTEEEVVYMYRGFFESVADQPALDLWTAAQEVSA